MSEYLADYAWPPHPSIDALRSAGCSGVIRYLSWLPNNKVITHSEYRQLVAEGLSVRFVWEYDAKDFAGYSFSAWEAATLCEQILRSIGAPSDSVVYYAVDWDVRSWEWSTVAENFRRGPLAVQGLARTGLYGPYDAIEWAHRDGLASNFWQAGLSYAWSGGRNSHVHPEAHLFQQYQQTIGGADCDLNLVLKPDGSPGGTTDMDAATEKALSVAFATEYDGVTGISSRSWMAQAVEAPLNAANVKLDSLAAEVRQLKQTTGVQPLDYAQLAKALLAELQR